MSRRAMRTSPAGQRDQEQLPADVRRGDLQNYLQLYGYTEATFRVELGHRLAEQRLENAVAKDRINSALADLTAGKDFGAVAGTWSDDSSTALNGGQAHFSAQALTVMDPNVRPA